MAPYKSKYDQSFKKQAVMKLLNTGQTSAEVAEELGIDAGLLRQWKHRYFEKENGSGDLSNGQKVNDKRTEKLKKELKELKAERDILKKALAIFTKDHKK